MKSVGTAFQNVFYNTNLSLFSLHTSYSSEVLSFSRVLLLKGGDQATSWQSFLRFIYISKNLLCYCYFRNKGNVYLSQVRPVEIMH